MHLESGSVNTSLRGQDISHGVFLGRTGTTGSTTSSSPYVHFEIRVGANNRTNTMNTNPYNLAVGISSSNRSLSNNALIEPVSGHRGLRYIVRGAGGGDTTTPNHPPANQQVTINFNANGGTGAPASYTVNRGANGNVRIHFPNTIPARTGYTFTGWRRDNNQADVLWQAGRHFYASTQGTVFTFFAQWTRNQPQQNGLATIRYDANGGTGAPATHSVRLDNQGVARFTLSTVRPTRNGYTFLGWRLNNDAAFGIDNPGQSIAFNTGNAAQDTTLTYFAQWQHNNTATVQYHANGTNVRNLPASQQVNVDAQGFVPVTISTVRPTRDDYTFLGWRQNNHPQSALLSPGQTFSQHINVNNGILNFYAQWQRNQQSGTATIRFDSNGTGVTNMPTTQSATVDAQGRVRLVLPTTEPIRTDYTFLGWRITNCSFYTGTFRAGASLSLCVERVGRDITFSAQWQRNQEQPVEIPAGWRPILSGGGSLADIATATGTIHLGAVPQSAISESGIILSNVNGSVIATASGVMSHTFRNLSKGRYHLTGYVVVNGVRHYSHPVLVSVFCADLTCPTCSS